MRWRCVKCGFIFHYTRPMPEHVVDPCPKCHGAKFDRALKVSLTRRIPAGLANYLIHLGYSKGCWRGLDFTS
jgi:hypothetical protein